MDSRAPQRARRSRRSCDPTHPRRSSTLSAVAAAVSHAKRRPVRFGVTERTSELDASDRSDEGGAERDRANAFVGVACRRVAEQGGDLPPRREPETSSEIALRARERLGLRRRCRK